MHGSPGFPPRLPNPVVQEARVRPSNHGYLAARRNLEYWGLVREGYAMLQTS